ncbi:4678_t:CDS:2, partial [Paraglomus occultum]
MSVESMRAVLVKEPGDASQLYNGIAPIPLPKDDELLVKIKCFALNRMDILQRQGRYPVPPGASQILGVEMSGVVEKIGSKGRRIVVVTKYKRGDHVFGLTDGGAYAEYGILHEDMTMILPEEMSFQQGAAIPEAWFTAYQVLQLIGQIRQGDNVLIHAGASGVGVAAIQLAKAAGAKHIFATAGSERKLAFIESIGVTNGINYKKENFRDKIVEYTDGYGVDLLIDFVGKDYWHPNIDSLAKDGRIVLVGFLSGRVVENFDLSVLLMKRLRVEGTSLRSRSLSYKITLRDEFYNKIFPRFIDGHGTFKVIVDREYDWKDIADAHRYMETNENIGKIV